MQNIVGQAQAYRSYMTVAIYVAKFVTFCSLWATYVYLSPYMRQVREILRSDGFFQLL